MKKKIVVVSMILMMIMPNYLSLAATANNVTYDAYYIAHRNEYRLDYWGYPSSVAGVRVKFTNAESMVWESEFGAEAITGIFYLTCSGTYDYFLKDSAGNEVASIIGITTNYIVNGSCSSYAAGDVKDDLNLSITDNGDGTYNLAFDEIPGAAGYEIYKDGALVGTVQSPPGTITGGGSVTVRAVDSSGNTLAESDSSTNFENSGGAACDGCQLIKDYLSCPEWGQYMGEWSNMIENSFPGTPYWQDVANVMRDTIVPAIGQELLERMPEYSDIIADEFQSREKPVTAPDPLPVFDPELPEMTDLTEKVEMNITEEVPSFEPDFTESKPFVIPDPFTAIDMSTDDKGYVYNSELDRTVPGYNKTETVEPDKGYKPFVEPVITAPEYTNTNPTTTTPIPAYNNTSNAETEPMPDYQTGQDDPIPVYTNTNSTTGEPMPEYQAK